MKVIYCVLFSCFTFASVANGQGNALQIGILPSTAEDSTDWVVQVTERQLVSGIESIAVVGNADVVVMQAQSEKFRQQTNSSGIVSFPNLSPEDGVVTVYVRRDGSKNWERRQQLQWRLPSHRYEITATRPIDPGWRSISDAATEIRPTCEHYCVSYTRMECCECVSYYQPCATQSITVYEPVVYYAPAMCWQ